VPDRPARIVVVGSVNVDIAVETARIPGPGETVVGEGARIMLGGKGANQAVAAARLGAEVTFLAAIGEDAFGREAGAQLQAAGIVSLHLLRKDRPTGLALITVAAEGQNAITVASGANMALSPADLGCVAREIMAADVLLLQNEIPIAVAREAAGLARKGAALVVLDPAPAAGLEPAVVALADLVTPNESEAASLFGRAPASLAEARALRSACFAAPAPWLLFKRGGEGCLWVSDSGEGAAAAFPVAVVDTVAAGDCFNAALAVALAEGIAMPGAVRFANAAAALCVARRGAAESLPTRAAVGAFLARHGA
jgi:ribokinase